MNKLRVGAIGSGYWGPNLIRNFVDLPDSELVVVADMRQERLDHMKRLYPSIEITTDYHDLFTMELDAVVIATPPFTHFDIAKDCLEHGLSCMIEKPITTDSQQAEALVELAEQRGLKLMVGNTFEYNVAVHKLRDLIASGELGDVYYIDAVRTNLGLYQRNLNVMWDLAPHDISILLHVLGMDPVSVSAQGGKNIAPSIHDVVYMHMQFPNNVMAHIHVSWLHPRKDRSITVVGSKKMVIYDDVEPLEKIKIYDKGVDAPPYADTFADFQFSYRYGDVITPYIKFTEPLRMECQHFVDCVKNGKRPNTDGVVGWKIVKILEAAERSLQNGGTQEAVNFSDIKLAEPAL
ncbi:MAG: Gfo/Idh/MocA family oxidoreductase [Anaerolineae bacterium]|nr:Gfo/Idh/MocA family oxidoreductase [Anaerolineae bacterium]